MSAKRISKILIIKRLCHIIFREINVIGMLN